MSLSLVDVKFSTHLSHTKTCQHYIFMNDLIVDDLISSTNFR